MARALQILGFEELDLHPHLFLRLAELLKIDHRHISQPEVHILSSRVGQIRLIVQLLLHLLPPGLQQKCLELLLVLVAT
jgi:hypothetical protein